MIDGEYVQRILGRVRKAVQDFDMIDEGDRIAVGVSAGKDSLTLLYAMSRLASFYPKRFEAIGITVDQGFPGADFALIQEFCDRLGVEYHVVPSNIKEVVFDIKKEHNPCSLCANLRRGMLNTAARRLGCNKVALAHHRDDAIETFFLSLFYEGRIYCFDPKVYLTRSGITVIRPLIYIKEAETKGMARRLQFPVITNPCPANGKTQREEMKRFVDGLSAFGPQTKDLVFNAIRRKLWMER
ncbi:tRNA 2-thiocytidine biosynthesis TtcA family protein [Mahella australiensis]|uniref:PP-loop domain protein n=1 Tax=Mahella australiensis (strain DSM 15567 / CIP 107919 / 50-1 BON) TaxID=697281 RepID=F3ZX39_MAHA5|nr:ATP-binding protein [Mahella australiensis]AEE95488.1 PP-loop domain protein [Mahella australiensis 50-1 BON]